MICAFNYSIINMIFDFPVSIFLKNMITLDLAAICKFDGFSFVTCSELKNRSFDVDGMIIFLTSIVSSNKH